MSACRPAGYSREGSSGCSASAVASEGLTSPLQELDSSGVSVPKTQGNTQKMAWGNRTLDLRGAHLRRRGKERICYVWFHRLGHCCSFGERGRAGGTGCHLGTPPSLAGPPPAHTHPSTLRSHLQVEAFLTLWEIESGPSGLSRAHESHVGHSYRHILIFVCAEVCAEFMRWSTVTC